jgi:hypothetical protein
VVGRLKKSVYSILFQTHIDFFEAGGSRVSATSIPSALFQTRVVTFPSLPSPLPPPFLVQLPGGDLPHQVNQLQFSYPIPFCREIRVSEDLPKFKTIEFSESFSETMVADRLSLKCVNTSADFHVRSFWLCNSRSVFILIGKMGAHLSVGGRLHIFQQLIAFAVHTIRT